MSRARHVRIYMLLASRDRVAREALRWAQAMVDLDDSMHATGDCAACRLEIDAAAAAAAYRAAAAELARYTDS